MQEYFFFDRMLNSHIYFDILGNNLIQSIDMPGLDEAFIFQQDDVFFHRARFVSEWLEEQTFTELFWLLQ